MAGFFKSKEEMVSMFLGLGIVMVVFFLIAGYIQRRNSGVVDVPGVVTEVTQTPTTGVVAGAVTKAQVTKAQATKAPEVTKVPVPTKQKEVAKKAVVVGDGSEYVVMAGDSLWKIAVRKYESGYNWVDIAKANKLTNPSIVRVGQKLVMPKVEKRVIASAPVKTITGNSYVVVKGDSLSKIALMAYGDAFAWEKIWQANSKLVTNPRLIDVGWKLTIPR